MADLAADQDNVQRAIATGSRAGTTPSPFASAPAMATFWTSHGDWTEGCEQLRTALDLPASDLRLRGRALVALGTSWLLRGDLAEAEVRLSEGRRLATDPDDAVVLARALAGEGYLEFRRSHVAEAQAVGRRRWRSRSTPATNEAAGPPQPGDRRREQRPPGPGRRPPRPGDRHGSTHGRRSTAPVAARLGRRGGTCGWATTRPLRTPGTPSPWPRRSVTCRLVHCCWPSWGGWWRGAIVTAEHLSIEAAELAEDLANRRAWAHALRLKGEALLRRWDPDAATVALDVHSVAEELGAGRGGRRALFASLSGARGGADRGGRAAWSARPRAVDGSAPMRRVSLRWVLGTAALMGGDLDVAEREFGNDLALAEQGQIVRHQANSLWGIARVRAAAGAVSQAAEFISGLLRCATGSGIAAAVSWIRSLGWRRS